MPVPSATETSRNAPRRQQSRADYRAAVVASAHCVEPATLVHSTKVRRQCRMIHENTMFA